MSYSSDDRQFSDKFLPLVKQIVGPRILEAASFTLDVEEAADLTTVRDSRVRIAVRIRRPKYVVPQYWNHITLRTSARVGLTELDKVISGYGDFLFYGFAAHDETALARWSIVDLSKLRLYLHRCFVDPKAENQRYGQVRTKDGDSFLWVDLSRVPATSGIVVDQGLERLSVYNASRDAQQMFSGKDDQFERLKVVAEPAGCYVVYEESAGRLADRLKRPLPSGFRDSTLYNIVYARSGEPVLCVNGQSYCEFDRSGQEIPSAILALESQNRFRALTALDVPTLAIDRSVEVPASAHADLEVWQYVAQDAILARLLHLGLDAPKIEGKVEYPCAGQYFKDEHGGYHFFDLALRLLGGGDPFEGGHLLIDDPFYKSRRRGFDVTDMTVLGPVADIDGRSSAALSMCIFRDGSCVAGLARVPNVTVKCLRSSEERLAVALSVSRMRARCEDIRRLDAAPDDLRFVAARMRELRELGALQRDISSDAEYESFVADVLDIAH